ncbi:DUF3526 domain-containing protein [Algoriphagus aestuariicola]|uniref:DUF3526 domain-containing protein n=1 Tax=Algoriphagus aestuariicola TaxID=1852016 RepID=A0ABS3BR35_9BACT|nr:DUF3526 domain-containing protein [Algoriphagus aestuariicola]MBN7801545.1 DUF3526 domain-containing protein [Algoriphagus aestuariicola]
MIKYLVKDFFRSKAHPIGLILLLVAGLISLEIGSRFLERSERISEKTAEHQVQSIQRNISHSSGDLGNLMYYLRFGLKNEVPRLAGLSIGQRDIYPSVQSVTVRNLEEQRYSTDLMNPLFQLLGNMDFSFVLIYFFPLVIIAFGFNLISEEREGGTWSLVLSQTDAPTRFLRYKLGIRLVSVLSVLILLLGISVMYLAIPIDRYLLAFALIAVVYVLFWFALVWLVVSFQLSSNRNAQILLACWVLLNLIVPAGINVLQRLLFPIPEAMTAVIENREGYHAQWDREKEPTLEHFYSKYPQYREFSHPSDQDFSWLWYFAMQQLGDDEARESVEDVKSKLGQRMEMANLLSWIVPTVHAQVSLNSVSFSDLGNYLRYMESLEGFHEGKKNFFFPKIFEGKPVSEIDWPRFTLERFQDSQPVLWAKILGPFILALLLLLVWANRNFTKSEIYSNGK